jgi:hypothetical protein
MANGMANAQKGATPRCCAHVANETTRDGVGLGSSSHHVSPTVRRRKESGAANQVVWIMPSDAESDLLPLARAANAPVSWGQPSDHARLLEEPKWLSDHGPAIKFQRWTTEK